MSTLAFASAAVIVLVGITWSFLQSGPREPYGLWHLKLNKLPDDDTDTPPKTEWLNMGYWKDTTVFPAACRALALKLAVAARLKPGASILDVGHGTGESLLLLLSDPSLPNLSKLTGITSLAAHHSRSRERVAATGKAILIPQRRTNSNDSPGINVEDKIDATQVVLYHGDAVFRRESSGASSGRSSSSELHPLDPSNLERFDTILVLDCAYHFDTRRAFLEQSFQKLNPEGRIALTDLCLSPPSHLDCQIAGNEKQTWTRRGWNWKLTVCRWLQCLPPRNELTADAYVKQLEDIGYVDIEMEDITEHVFPPFCAFMRKTGFAGWVFGSVLRWFMDAGGKFVVVTAMKPSAQ